MVIKTLASVAVISALGLLTSMQAYAFGLGNITTSSALNEPFKAEIAVTAIRGNEAGNLQVRLASSEEFERAGIERSFLLSKFKFEVVEKAGSATIFITTKVPIKEPFVEFLVTATTGHGRLIREYTVLLDPPKTVFTKPIPVKKAAKVVKESTQKSNVTSYQYDAPSSSSNSLTSYGPTDRTDTLWDIALKTKQEKSISVHQQMMALVQENPRAFIRNNINGLKAGYTLSIPSADVVKALSKSQAISAVREQNSTWKNRNKTPSAPVVVVEEAVTSTNSMKEVETVTEPSEVVAEVVEGENTTARLKLVAPNDEPLLEGGELSPMGSDNLSKLSEQLTLAQEKIEGQAQENIDIKSRMDVMEEQIQTLRRLISLKDADLARLQSSLEQGEQVEVDDTLDQMTENTLALLEEQDAQLNTEENIDVQSQTEMTEVEQYFASIGQDEPTIEQTDSIADVSVTEELVAEPTENVIAGIDLSAIPSVDEVIAYTSNLLDMDTSKADSLFAEVKIFVAEHKKETMSGALLFLLILWLLVRRRNRPDMTWDEAVEKLDDSESVIAPPVYDNTSKSNDNSDEMLVEEIEEGNTSEEIIADIQEETIEESTEVEEPKSEALGDTTDSDDVAKTEQERSDLAFNIESLPPEENLSDDVPTDSDVEHGDLASFDPNAEIVSEDVKEQLSNEPLSFDVASTDSDSSDEELLTIDIESGNLEETTENSDLETDSNELEFDLSDFDEVDEAETKLDLAAAYIDMGDPDGAKSILEEVLNEGNEEQKGRAQAMLTDLS